MAKLGKLPDLNSLDIKPSKPKNFYEKEAKNALKALNKNDKNFKFFLKEIVQQTKESVDIDTLRDIVSDLQKYICNSINNGEYTTHNLMIPLRNKIKTSKKAYFDKFSEY